MNEDMATQFRKGVGPWYSATAVTDRRGAQVWRVRMINGATVAVKTAAGDEIAALLPAREAAVIRAAGPVAGRVLGTGRLLGSGSWMAAPWWHGPPLEKEFTAARKEDGVQARQRAAGAAAAAAGAVADLHAAGWAHGDLQAEHVLHTPHGTKLLDLAWAHGPDGAIPPELNPPYAGPLVHLEAPETARLLLDGQPASPTPQADVYALGGMLFACWTGTWPVDYAAAGVDTAPGSLLLKRRAVASGHWMHPTGSMGWRDFAELLQTTLAIQPEKRPTAHALAAELARLADRPTAR